MSLPEPQILSLYDVVRTTLTAQGYNLISNDGVERVRARGAVLGPPARAAEEHAQGSKRETKG